MEIIGKGFLSRHLEAAFGDRHPDTTVICAGVTRTTSAEIADFDREAALVHETVRRCKRTGRTLVFFSTASDSMYGAEGCSGHEDGPVYPISAYGRHKLSMEAVLASSGADWLVFRLSHIVGEGQRPHQLIPSLTAQVRTGQVTLHRNAHRDLLDVRHMVKALEGVLAIGVRHQVINVASGVLEPIERIVDGIEQRLGVRASRTMKDVYVTTTRTSTARLRMLVPEWNEIGFGPEYLPGLLDRYVGPVRGEAEFVGQAARSL
ncbi:NAD-dependent epimerase/dehydratase family protein [Kutzneria viridogrisea]|uniref:NDP-hexose 4-ketoreductase n=1 Tax=Kutzneria albida DSM 43870 TaxID=1449976 RepID=W5W3U5_9PSEU|nr:NDP-hexose 4-ketoreductase [Kutzneria albida DSM 43870]